MTVEPESVQAAFTSLYHEYKTRGINILKTLHGLFGWCESTTYAWAEGRCQLPALVIQQFTTHFKDGRLLKELCRNCGYIAVEVPEGVDLDEPTTARGVAELNDLIQALHTARSDGWIDRKGELPKIRRECYELIEWAQSVLQEAESQATDCAPNIMPITKRQSVM